jgi:hypothetical protein
MKPPKNMFLAEFFQAYDENGKVFSKLTRNKFLLAGTQRGVGNRRTSAGKTGDIPFRHGRQRFNPMFQSLILLIHPASGVQGRPIQSSNSSLP